MLCCVCLGALRCTREVSQVVFKWLKWHQLRYRGGFLWLVGWLVLFEVKIQHITLMAEFGGNTSERIGWTHRPSDSDVRVKQEECLDSFMHRLWLFSCSHSPPWLLREGRKEKRKGTKKQKINGRSWTWIRCFPASISEDLMHHVIKADLETHYKHFKPHSLWMNRTYKELSNSLRPQFPLLLVKNVWLLSYSRIKIHILHFLFRSRLNKIT